MVRKILSGICVQRLLLITFDKGCLLANKFFFIKTVIFFLFTDLDKHVNLGKKFLMTINGESGDATNFAEFIEKNIALYKMNNGNSHVLQLYKKWILLFSILTL